MEPVKDTDRTVFSDKGRVYTISRSPGIRVYGERLLTISETEYREWSPDRSKLSAYIMSGGTAFPFTKSSHVLYLGAASGTTSSHVSDIVRNGKVYCVEFSPRSFRDLVKTAEKRDNMNPILGDATNPEEYSFLVDNIDIVYSDVAQKNQADILVNNMERFNAKYGMVCIKARSEDVTAEPKIIFEEAKKYLLNHGCRIRDMRSLEPYEGAHAMIVVERPKTVYCVVIKDNNFLMVYNLKRKGWEMPGGKVEENETTEEAAIRECLEESGYQITLIDEKNIGYCDVCVCLLGKKIAKGEMESELFGTLPGDLAFDTDEYEDVIEWARCCIHH